ncbi:hypothetical protein EI94DRAFT_352610 [Lactarius quietus]|nr:hypothetical protein EI94DRAFT_352610 [Lactarius quietus]
MDHFAKLTKLVILVDTHYVFNWPEARDIVDTYRLVPLPVYDTRTHWEADNSSHYKDAGAGAVLRINVTLTHWFIPASGASEAANTFVTDIKPARILLMHLHEGLHRKEELQKLNLCSHRLGSDAGGKTFKHQLYCIVASG